MKFFVVLLPLLGLGTIASSPEIHKFYVSKMLIEYNNDEQTIQVSTHIFIDDLEEALRQDGADDLFLCTAMEAENAEKALGSYLLKITYGTCVNPAATGLQINAQMLPGRDKQAV